MIAPPISPLRLEASAAPVRPDRSYVLYWMTATRRTRWSHGMQHAAARARELGKPLLVFEPLRAGSAWASRRVHRFVIQGMADNARALSAHGITYFPWVEPDHGASRGLLEALAADAALVVTDQFPVHFLPRMRRSATERLDVRVEAVDSLGLIPVAAPDRDFTVAHSFRRWIQKELPDLWDPPVPDALDRSLAGAALPASVTSRWPALSGGRPTGTEPLPATIPGPDEVTLRGGSEAASAQWRHFLAHGLPRYATDRSHPDDDVQSGLSPWLHFGHIGAWELVTDLLPSWNPVAAPPAHGKREGWWGASEDVESYLDELVTWRELGAVQAHRDHDGFTTYQGLPDWARRTLDEHRADPRPEVYSLEDLDGALTSDPLWNAAQNELREQGRIHNALRMLWGKKVLGWTRHPEEAFEVLVELNNRYALDGRDPNSWSGIGWVFGRFDRAWGPERAIYGKVRYMTSESSRRKWRLDRYLARYANA